MPKVINLTAAATTLLLLAAVVAAQPAIHTFGDLIDSLRRQGYVIIYSNSLLSPAEPIPESLDPATPDLEELTRLLDQRQLQLQQHGKVWTIRRSEQPRVKDQLPAKPAPEQALENIIVTGTLHRITEANLAGSMHRLSSNELAITPSAASDPLRASLRLPGVSSVGVSAKPRIRGGLQDELLVIQDGVELLEPFHLADYHSAYSTIDYYAIESIDFYTGGFPSRYGNRMSGVMDIRNDWGEREHRQHLGISTFANFYSAHGELVDADTGNWQLSLRQGDLSDLTDYIQSRSGQPEYQDAATRLTMQLNKQLQLTLGGSYAKDDIHFIDAEEAARARVATHLLWAGLQWQQGQLRSNLTLSWLDLGRDKRLTSFEEEAEDKGGELNHQQDIERWSLRHDLSLLRNDLLLEFGWQAERSRAHYQHHSRINRGDLADLLDTEREVERDLDLRPRGWSGGAYVQAEWSLSPELVVQPSLRWDFQDYYLASGSRQQLAPRIGLAYEFQPETFLRLSLGRFYQPEGVQELQVLDGVTEFYAPQRSDQYIVGLIRNWRQLSISADIYYKRYANQKGRFENVFNPFVLLPEMEPDRIAIAPRRAETQGLDLEVHYEWSAIWSGQLRYSFMDAWDRIDDRKIDRRWSQRHTVHAGLTWQSDSFTAAVVATWHSGWRSTRLPTLVDDTLVLADYLNNTELRSYASLDINIRKRWPVGANQIEVFADISNLTDRKNIAGIDFDLEETDEEDVFELVPDFETLLGRVVSLGIIFSF
ncbi:TonB-dependent receptor [Pseudomaricurvus alcaniphilus]|uniref:TonB-dependent receptor plug domain-containing protein n=1 Tax=Pseudomaricurvus alcaniphilus TaxID=1166482 RepID=UPI00140741AE|nr:TonB-dependent receptor [Pseudomaricurvus alcaniphilus]NHN38664.1 TonB-dependent receptor [Pseudomaricurvus alcaniphilus]